MIKKIFKSILILLVIGVFYFLFYPVPFDPVSYTPPPDPGLNEAFAQNDKLASTKTILNNVGAGPEDITLGPDSMLYTGLADGRIIRFSADGQQTTTFANTEGRPLGMKFDADGNLIVADEYKGLLSIDSLGQLSILANEVNGTKIFFADHLDIAADGKVYFSDASQRNHDAKTEAWKLQPTGRLLSYDPSTRETRIELDGLRFANGVALGPNDQYVLVTETFGMVINKFWLKGPKKGQKETWINELPGYPDNITCNDQGIFWLAIPTLRAGPEFEGFYEKPFLRKMIARLPKIRDRGQGARSLRDGHRVGYNRPGAL